MAKHAFSNAISYDLIRRMTENSIPGTFNKQKMSQFRYNIGKWNMAPEFVFWLAYMMNITE